MSLLPVKSEVDTKCGSRVNIDHLIIPDPALDKMQANAADKIFGDAGGFNLIFTCDKVP